MSESRDLHTALTQVQQTLANASTGNNLPLSKRAQAGRLLDPLTLLLHHIGEAIDRVLVNVLGSSRNCHDGPHDVVEAGSIPKSIHMRWAQRGPPLRDWIWPHIRVSRRPHDARQPLR